ncbi:MAG: hypothetical protein N2593_00165 [Patescibacteria group bacterium]|nr:hypothetical protein [Patescibacteria group bacterium]
MIYNFARKIHRFFMFLTIFLTVVMWLTGQVMEEGWGIMSDYQARTIHRNASKFFTLSLGLMTISGLIMYFYPIIKNIKIKKIKNE